MSDEDQKYTIDDLTRPLLETIARQERAIVRLTQEKRAVLSQLQDLRVRMVQAGERGPIR
jgi:hypothetical protein